jgi:hypothetical protein
MKTGLLMTGLVLGALTGIYERRELVLPLQSVEIV